MLTINSLRLNQIFIFGFVIFASLLLTVKSASAQNSRDDLHDGPLIHNFGRHVDLPNAAFKTNTDMVYKVAFEILQALGEPTSPHMRIETAARFVNLHAHAGVPPENIQLAIVLHGGGTQAALPPNIRKIVDILVRWRILYSSNSFSVKCLLPKIKIIDNIAFFT